MLPPLPPPPPALSLDLDLDLFLSFSLSRRRSLESSLSLLLLLSLTLSRDLDLHFRISAEQFQTEYCSPYALVAKFIARVARTEVAYTKNNPAWVKLYTALWEDPALRKEVLRVKRLDAPFESKDKGIPECIAFMQSIEAQKIAEA